MLDTGSGEVGSEEAVSSDGGGCPVVTGMRQRNTSEDCLPGRDLERLTPSFPTRRVGGLKAGEADGGDSGFCVQFPALVLCLWDVQNGLVALTAGCEASAQGEGASPEPEHCRGRRILQQPGTHSETLSETPGHGKPGCLAGNGNRRNCGG